MSRILQVNKFFFPGAGAETVLFQTRRLLEDRGHEVVDFAMRDQRNVSSPWEGMFARPRHYDRGPSLAAARDAFASVYSWESRRALRRLIATARPDIAHLHNIYHQLTLSVVDELWTAGIPTVLTLHDYKPVCPSYTIYTEGAPCRRCVRGTPFNAIVHRCIKHSRAASTVAAIEAAVVRLRRTYERLDAFIAPSRFLAGVMQEGGVGTGRVHVLPNFVNLTSLQSPPRRPDVETSPPYVLFIGRLEEVKGIRQLLKVFRDPPAGLQLRVLGSGSLRSEVIEAANRPEVEYLGALPWVEVAHQLDGARALVVPSLWEENCPMVVLEARGRSTPVICSDRGGLPELVKDRKDGLVFRAGDRSDLLRCLALVADEPEMARRFGAHGHERLRMEHNQESHYQGLMEVYEEAERVRRARSSRRPRHPRGPSVGDRYDA